MTAPSPGPGIRRAIDVAPLGELSDPRAIVRLAVAAERAGWDGISTWDSLGVSIATSAADPFVSLTAVAAATRRLRLIASVIALPRRRPHLVAQAAASLDLTSDGRLVLGVGSGGDPGDFTPFGESYDRADRIARFDEGLPIVDAFLRGERVDHDGPTYTVRGVAVGPRPAQRPRPPIWLGGMKPGALRRAAAWDGWIAIAVAEDGSGMNLDPEAFGLLVARLDAERAAAGRAADPFDVAVFGLSDPAQPGLVGRFAAAGATWWLESLSPLRGSLGDLLAIVEAGPPT
jgi:alkanesulfonate monooxygenase SsuD/methylene tetrahydromethanopterin reductase-like flavin-dependent oxidoreductase (luciferase family)